MPEANRSLQGGDRVGRARDFEMIGTRAAKDPLVAAVEDESLRVGHESYRNLEAFVRIRNIAFTPDVSPLRYPGGKRKLAVLIAEILSLANRRISLFVEPFAGGAAVSIALLEAGFANEIALADKDDLVAAFWKTVFSVDAETLARNVEVARLSVSERDRIVQSNPTSDLDRAFKCIFLNRTSFSGMLNERAGPIGGREQKGKYKIGCRFNRIRLAQRIRDLSKLSHKVLFVRCQDYEQTIHDVESMRGIATSREGIFWYFDPPFFEKADRLYRHVFNDEQHRSLRDTLPTVPGWFVLSYDDVPAAERLYANDTRTMSVAMTYQAGQDGYRAVRELIVSNLLNTAGEKIAVHNRTRFVLRTDRRRRTKR